MPKRPHRNLDPRNEERAFKQPPCSSDSFRLFRIVSFDHDLPVLHLEVFSLKSHPDYVAISYTWDPRPRTVRVVGYGRDTKDSTHTFLGRPFQNKTNPNQSLPNFPKKRIVINDQHYDISFHLLGGLRAVHNFYSRASTYSDLEKDSTPRPDPLWLYVDAISISQNDPDDKARQVANMHNIYRQATRVFAWLGKGGYNVQDSQGRRLESVGYCLPHVPRLHAMLKAAMGKWEECGKSFEQYYEATKDAQDSGVRADDKYLWICLAAFTHIPWWERLWVVQEAVLGQNVMILCGQFSLSWSSYVDFMKTVGDVVQQSCAPNFPRDIATNFMPMVFNARALMIDDLRELDQLNRRVTKTGETKLTIEELLMILVDIIRKSFVLEPLDRVYAVLGLVEDKIRHGVDIDYSADSKSKYWLKWIEFCKAAIAAEPRFAMSLFAQASYLKRDECMPSWCPILDDNSYSPMTIATNLVASTVSSENDVFKTESNYAADTDISIFPVSDSNILRAVGMRLDRVTEVVNFGWTEDAFADKDGIHGVEGDIPQPLAKKMLQYLSTCSQILVAVGLNVLDSEAAVARCLVSGAYFQVAQHLQKLKDDYELYKTWLSYHSIGPDARSVRNTSLETETPEYGLALQSRLSTLAFFITDLGRPGSTSWKVKSGDWICRIKGLALAYVLRKSESEETYEFIGEAYMDEVVGGKIQPETDTKKQQTETFLIH